ncbi:MAG: FAD-dependent oxidoreductase [Micropruina sp.]|nr:FAD-dependent oxidoreductase [Micropruina sp.]
MEFDSPRVAIVGAGPSGLFAAQSLLADPSLRVDIFDRLPSPFGLLRYGVAPDHTSIKSVATALARVFDSDRVRFHGLVQFGRDVTRDELLAAYDAVIYAAGASEDLRMRIPGEDLPGSRSAREFVAWYSGHPDAPRQDLHGVRRAATVGVGNVAVDVARILIKTRDQLAETDMPEAVLNELHAHEIDDVYVIGRRGPQHASFTTTELRELVSTPGVQVIVPAESFEGVEEASLDRRTRANLQVLAEAAARVVEAPRARLHFLFWRRPVELTGGEHVSAITLERTALDVEGRVIGTGELTNIPVELVLRAIGYRAVPLPGVPFDATHGVIPNAEGRVLGPTAHRALGEYVVGWIKRGPIGVIGTNKSDAAQTVRHLLADLAERPAPSARLDLAGAMRARGFAPSSFEDWQRIDAAEVGRGHSAGRERTKIEAWHELLDLVRRERPGGPATPGDR